MFEFFAIATSLPAAPFGALLVLALGWWGLALLGVVDDDAIDGALEGAADGPPPLTTYMTRYVPITAWIALFAAWGWIVSFTLGWSWRQLLPGVAPGWTAALAGLGASAVAAALLARLTSRPLAPFFETQHGRERSSLDGEIALVTTGRVDDRFGQARLVVGGDDLVIQVRCDRADNALKRGDPALVVRFDTKRDAYVVEPAHHLSNRPEA